MVEGLFLCENKSLIVERKPYMNLKEIINQVGNILDYNPDVPEYREEVRNTFNDIYTSMFSDRKWKWAQKEVKLWAFADVALPSDERVASQVQLYNDYNGTSYYAYITVITADVPSWLSAGNVISITGGTTLVGNDPLPNLGDYWITQIIQNSEQHPNKTLIYFQRMDKDFQRMAPLWERTPRIGMSNPDVTCIFKHRYITLPQDCIGLVGIGLREASDVNGAAADLRPFDVLPKYVDEQFSINLDETGRPTDYVPEADYYVKPPMLEPIATVTVGPVITTLRAPFSGKYDVCYTFVQAQNVTSDGIAENQRCIPWESGPSPISDEVVPAVGTDGVNCTNMQVTNVYDGLRKRVYVRAPGSNRFYATEEYPVSHTVTSRSIIFDNANPVEMFTNAKPLFEHGGVYQRIRLYPRQDKDYLMTIRYLYRPQRLVDDTDSPDVPAVAHKYLIFRTAEELFFKHNNLNQGKIYQEKANKELLNLENRWLTEPAAINIKKPFAPGKSLFDYRYAQKLTSRG